VSTATPGTTGLISSQLTLKRLEIVNQTEKRPIRIPVEMSRNAVHIARLAYDSLTTQRNTTVELIFAI
jgi:hypothetical protein